MAKALRRGPSNRGPRSGLPPIAPQLPPILVGVVGPQDYRFGTHSQAIYNAEALKSQLFRPAASAPVAPAQLGHFTLTASQPYLDVASQVFQSARTPIVATTGILGKFINVPEQLADRSTPSSIFTPQYLPQGYIVQILDQAPQFTPDIASVIFPSVRTPVAPTNALAKFLIVPQEVPPQPQSVAFASAFASATPKTLGAFVYSSPDQSLYAQPSVLFPTVIGQATQAGGGFKVTPEQAYDRTLQAVLIQPWHGPQGAVPPFQSTREQFFDPTPQPVNIPNQPALPLVTGVTVFPLPAVPPQTDLNLNASVVWTPGTFSPGIPPTPDTGIPLGPIGPVRSMFDASHRKKRRKPEQPTPPPAIEQAIEFEAPIQIAAEPEPFSVPLADLLALDTKLQLSAKRLELLEQQKSDHEAALVALWMMLED